MPLLKIETNVKSSDIKDLNAALKELSQAVAKTTGKPEGYVIAQIVPDQAMIFGGSDGPCATATLLSIGKIGTEENKKHASVLYPLVTKLLGVPADRMYMHFQDVTTANLGFQSTTFHELFG